MLLGLIAQISDVEIGSCSDRKTNQSSADVDRRVVDDDDDDDDAFTHSGALTIKSSRQSADTLFSNVGSTVAHATESSLCLSPAVLLQSTTSPQCDPSVNDINSYSCFDSMDVRHPPPSAVLPDSGKVIAGTNVGSDLRAFLSEIGLGKYADIFYQQDVDLPMFLTLTEDDLKEIGIR